MTREEQCKNAAKIYSPFDLDQELAFLDGSEWADANRWVKVDDGLPEDNKLVLLLHEDSGNAWTTYRTKDCITGQPRWQDNSMPSHWQYITLPEPPKVEQ